MAEHRGLSVRFDERVWSEAIRGFWSRTLEVATSARARLAYDGLVLAALLPCSGFAYATELAGCAKLYLPIGNRPASERPFAFVLQLARTVDPVSLVWAFVAFGPRHPAVGVRSVYERAHRQLHGRFPT